MDFTQMTMQQLEERKAAIAAELDRDDADLDALGEEARAIKEELEKRAAENAKREELRAAVAGGQGVTVTKFDLANNKISATITATMMDYAYLATDGEYGTPETKTLTASIKNYPLDNWTGRLYKSMKKLKTK